MDRFRQCWIWEMPDFSHGLQFTTPTVYFFVELLVIFYGIYMCFKGYKVFRSAALVIAAVVFGLVGVRVSEQYTRSLLFKMVFFVIAAFLGLCLSYFAGTLLDWLGGLLHVDRLFRKYIYIFSAAAGALIAALTVYLEIFHSAAVCAVLLTALASGGILYQRKKKDRVLRACTYDDLLKLPR